VVQITAPPSFLSPSAQVKAAQVGRGVVVTVVARLVVTVVVGVVVTVVAGVVVTVVAVQHVAVSQWPAELTAVPAFVFQPSGKV